MRVTRRRSEIANRLALKKQQLAQVPNKAFDFFHDITPIKSGRARKNTRLTQDTILADYPYAQRLDKGWSRQAPNGMSRPTLDYIRQLVRRILGR